MRTVLNLNLARRGSPHPTQVQQMTSAFERISRSHARVSALNLRSSLLLSSPCSFLSWMSFCSSVCVSLLATCECSVRCETDDSSASRDLAVTRTTLSPVAWIFSVSWSTATFDGAQTSTWPGFILLRWYTIDADVTVLPVPGGPCDALSVRKSAESM